MNSWGRKLAQYDGSETLKLCILCCNSAFSLGQERKEKQTYCIRDPDIVNGAVGGSEIKLGHSVSCTEMANRSSSFVYWEESLQKELRTSLIRL